MTMDHFEVPLRKATAGSPKSMAVNTIKKLKATTDVLTAGTMALTAAPTLREMATSSGRRM